MISKLGQSKFVYGMHEKCPLEIMPAGWVLHIAEVGDSGTLHPGIDLSGEPRARMIRIQWKFGSDGGCYPPPHLRSGFIQRVTSLARNTPECHVWVGGNEPNIKTEGMFTPEYTAQNYNDIRTAIQMQSGHENDQVLLPPIGPWNAEIGYGWIEYFVRLIALCQVIDGFALHSYSRGPDPASIMSEAKMGPPYEDFYSGFLTYRDWMHAIPEQYRDRPCYVTETNQNGAWVDGNQGWVQAAYKEINDWNTAPGNQQIRALILYRWPRFDKYFIEGKQRVIDDFKIAMEHNYSWIDDEVPNGGNSVGWETVYEDDFENGFYDQNGIGELTIPLKHHVVWNESMARPEMDTKDKNLGHPEVFAGRFSAVGFLPYAEFQWCVFTDTINVAAGLRTKASTQLMIVSHGVGGDPGRPGECGLRVGVGPADDPQKFEDIVSSQNITWADWWVVRGSLENERVWRKATTPEFIPRTGQIRLYVRCNADVAAAISAGHWDAESVEQYDDAPGPQPGVRTLVEEASAKIQQALALWND